MENEVVLLDTSILIEYYRKKDKSKSVLFHLFQVYSIFAVSAVTHLKFTQARIMNRQIFGMTFFNKLQYYRSTQKYPKKLRILMRA